MRPPIWSTIWIFVNELCTMENTNNRNRSTGSIAVLQSMTHIDQRILMLWTQTYLHSNPKFAKSLSSIAMRTFLVSAMVGCQNEPVFFARVFSLLASTFAKLCTPHGACDTSTLPVHLFYLFPGKRLSVWLARAVSLSLSLSLSLSSLSLPLPTAPLPLPIQKSLQIKSSPLPHFRSHRPHHLHSLRLLTSVFPLPSFHFGHSIVSFFFFLSFFLSFYDLPLALISCRFCCFLFVLEMHAILLTQFQCCS